MVSGLRGPPCLASVKLQADSVGSDTSQMTKAQRVTLGPGPHMHGSCQPHVMLKGDTPNPAVVQDAPVVAAQVLLNHSEGQTAAATWSHGQVRKERRHPVCV